MAKFTPQFFARNRQQIAAASLSDVLVIAANQRMQYGPDVSFPFRQDSYFWYLSGCEVPGATLVISSNETFLIMPRQDKYDVISDGAFDTANITATSGVNNTYDYNNGWQKLTLLLKDARQIGVLGSKRRPEPATTANAGRVQLLRKLRRVASRAQLEDVRPQLVSQRMIKQPAEIAAIQRAIDITAEAFSELAQSLPAKKIQHEYEAEALLAYTFRKNNTRHAYTPIVAGGKNACTIHYTYNRARLSSNQLLLIDMGAEFLNYASDITRTLALSRPTNRQQEIIAATLEVQNYAYSLIKPGLNRRDYELAVEEKMGSMLAKLGLITNKTRQNIRKYYPHATSHHLGLDVHDVADYTQPFAKNMVLTVEPGIYIPEENIGVRIEDDVLVTDQGIKVLSHHLPSTFN